MGSSSWAGSEKRTAAISDTPMNLRRVRQVLRSTTIAERMYAYFFKIPTKVLSLLLSSGVFSATPRAAPPGVEALEDCSEGGADRPDDDEAIWARCRDTQAKRYKCFGMSVKERL